MFINYTCLYTSNLSVGGQKSAVLFREKLEMSSSNSFSSTYTNDTTSTPIEVEDELHERENIHVELDDEDSHGHDDESHDSMNAYSDEPIADENWLRDYHRRQQEDEQRMNELEIRLNGGNPVTSW